jgi:beta-N-acetylhexosaminidase
MPQVYKIMHKLFIIIILTFYSSLLLAQNKIMYPFPDYENDKWVDSVFNSLSIDEKIGQLIMLQVSSAKGIDHISQVETMVEDYKDRKSVV